MPHTAPGHPGGNLRALTCKTACVRRQHTRQDGHVWSQLTVWPQTSHIPLLSLSLPTCSTGWAGRVSPGLHSGWAPGLGPVATWRRSDAPVLSAKQGHLLAFSSSCWEPPGRVETSTGRPPSARKAPLPAASRSLHLHTVGLPGPRFHPTRIPV